jgi:hypothetical protein
MALARGTLARLRRGAFARTPAPAVALAALLLLAAIAGAATSPAPVPEPAPDVAGMRWLPVASTLA